MMTLDAFRAAFRYRADGRWGEWRIGIEGDCEDFALTSAFILAGQSKLRLIWGILTLRFVFWFGRADWNGETHWMLWARGHGYTCNIHMGWAATTPHRRLLPVIFVPALLVPFIRNRLPQS
jgi:hypothetical protein